MGDIFRKCAGCSRVRERSVMIKITLEHSSKKVILNPSRHTFGRSVYLCPDESCIENAFKKNRIFKILKTKPEDSLKNYVKNCTCKHGCATNILETNLEN